jgi:hypothetical protein
MIKKLRNQPYAPKSGESSQIGAKGKKKNSTEPYLNISVTMYERAFFLYPPTN